MATGVAGELYESLTGQLFEIGRQLRQPNGYPYDPLKLQRHLQDAIEGRFLTPVYLVSVDYELTVEQAVKLGRYDWVNKNITQRNFPTQRERRAEIVVELIHFNRYISSVKVLERLDRMGYRPTELRELLAFGEKYPNIQCEFPIVALGGSAWWSPDGHHRAVPHLYGLGWFRGLGLTWIGDGWDEGWRFAAIRK